MPNIFIKKDDIRSSLIIKNISGSFVIKSATILVNLLLVPLTLHYLNSFDYGIWLTLSSILLWISYFDIGLGNGLRNKLAEALALRKYKLAQIYISTTFFILIGIVFFFYLMFVLFQSFIDWNKLLNVPINKSESLSKTILIIFFIVAITSVFKIIGIIYISNHLPVINDVITFMGNLMSLIGIFILTKLVKGSLFNVALVYSISPLIVILLVSIFTFKIKYPYLKPKINLVKVQFIKELMGLSFSFFFLQIAGMIIFTSANLLISHFYGPHEVTVYNLSFKYFTLITYIFGIIITPYWAAITDAHIKKDLIWIEKSIKQLKKVWLYLVLLTICMLIFSNLAYKFWVGDSVKVPISLSIIFTFYISITNYNNILAFVLNGMGKLRIQIYCAIIVILIFFPLSFFLNKYFQTNGILLTMCITLLISTILQTIQLKKVIANKATGIWNK